MAPRQLRSFTAIGVISTLAYIALYSALHPVLGDTVANALSQLLTAIGNTAANRRFTFDAAGNGTAARDHLGGLTAFVVALGLTTSALAVLHLVSPRDSPSTELAVLVGTNLLATAVRFFLLRAWITPRGKARPTMLLARVGRRLV